jgi:integral membrane protein (TIGR01906 family)
VSTVASAVIAISAALLILGLAVALMLTPVYIHAALDDAGSAAFLGVTPAQAHDLSDRTVGELLFGPGTFAFPMEEGGPSFYDAAEASHLRDARAVFYGFLAAVVAALVVLAAGVVRSGRAAPFWRAVSRRALGLSAAFAIVGALFLVAFDAAFTLFHKVFFPGGNWSFDPRTEHMVQLYPIPFWERTTTVLGALAIVLGLAVWWLARDRAVALERGAA